MSSTPEFHLGITMAGAASAGCYTGGAMDYLFEILDLWEKAKNKQLPPEWGTDIYNYVPSHKVIIDVMGGTSAGGMTTVMSAIYALKGQVKPVRDPIDTNSRKGNIFYDSWVLMGDDKNPEKLLARAFGTSDLEQSQKIQSLLHSGFIDAICDDVFKDDVPNKQKPVYISDQLEMVLSHTMLRSVPLAIDFTTPVAALRKSHDNPAHNTFDHFTVSHFKLDYNAATHADKYLPLDPFGKTGPAMKLATMATGAFPVGLKFREFFAKELSTAYIQHTAEQIVFDRPSGTNPSGIPDIKWPAEFPNPFDFVSVDGGAINNEPFGEVLSILRSRYGIKKPDTDYSYALIMIDPFPDVVSEEPYKQPDDLFSVVPAIIGTLWDQAKVKRAEMLDAFSNDYYRGEIFPARHTYDEGQKKYIREKVPIATGTAMAFGGFLDISFRHHDFFLGRDNARNFFRFYFSFEYDPANGKVHPIHQSWTPEMVGAFKITRDGKTFLPIVPDLYYLQAKLKGDRPNPYQRSVSEWPVYDPAPLFAIKDKMEGRFKKMLEMTWDKLTGEKAAKEKAKTLTCEWMEKHYRSNWFKRLTGWIGSGVLRTLFNSNKGKIANRITQSAIEWVLKDLEKSGLLKKP